MGIIQDRRERKARNKLTKRLKSCGPEHIDFKVVVDAADEITGYALSCKCGASVVRDGFPPMQLSSYVEAGMVTCTEINMISQGEPF